MSGYILCRTKKASVPFYIENISTNIYSLEELCYFLYHNLYLIDQTIINERLCDWLRDELDCPALAVKLRPCVGKFASAEDILYPVFKEINYLTYEELRGLNAKLAKMDREPLSVREKKKADALAENGMYVNAIRTYQKLLSREDLEESRQGLTGSIYHNLGCTYSYLFQTEKALECFEQAYACAKDPEALKCYLLALRSVRTPIEYESRMAELEVPDDIRADVEEALDRFASMPEKPVYSQHVDSMLESFMKEYHRETGTR